MDIIEDKFWFLDILKKEYENEIISQKERDDLLDYLSDKKYEKDR
jgi:hypothetical protein